MTSGGGTLTSQHKAKASPPLASCCPVFIYFSKYMYISRIHRKNYNVYFVTQDGKMAAF